MNVFSPVVPSRSPDARRPPANASTTAAATTRPVQSEAGPRLRRRVRPAVVRRHHLDVERAIATVHVVLDPDIWELHMPLVVAREVVLQRPGADLFKLAIWSAVTVAPVPIRLSEELL